MDVNQDIDEVDFVKHLNALGVDTLGLSFGWILENDEHGLLRWIYKNFDNSNSLTQKERYKYAEFHENNLLLPADELEEYINHLLEKYDELVLPGDNDGFEMAELNLENLNRKLALLHKQEQQVDLLLEQNCLARNDINKQISELNDARVKAAVDLETAESQCLEMAEQIEKKTNEFVAIIAENLNIYKNLHSDIEFSNHFIVSGPFEQYVQNRRLFQSHCRLYASREFVDNAKEDGRVGHHVNGADASDDINVNQQLKKFEIKLRSGLWAYVESVAELAGALRKLETATAYRDVHASQVPIATAECSSSIEILKQDIEMLQKQKLHFDITNYVDEQCAAVLATEGIHRLNERKAIYSKLCSLLGQVSGMLNLDSLLYFALRREITYTEDFIQFANDVRHYLVEDQNAVQSRMAAMKSIQAEHQDSNGSHEVDGAFIQALKAIYSLQPDDTLDSLFASVDRVCSQISEYNIELDGAVRLKESNLKKCISNTIKLRDYIWDGCTKQPSFCDRNLSLLFHSLRKQAERVESQVNNSVKELTLAKTKSKEIFHKLWIWFLTNPEKLLAAIEEAKTKCGTSRRPFAS